MSDLTRLHGRSRDHQVVKSHRRLIGLELLAMMPPALASVLMFESNFMGFRELIISLGGLAPLATGKSSMVINRTRERRGRVADESEFAEIISISKIRMLRNTGPVISVSRRNG